MPRKSEKDLIVQLARETRRRDSSEGRRLIEDFFESPIPQDLWHYTNMDGLRGILRSGAVWATDVRHTTDRTEFLYAREVIRAYLSGLTSMTKGERYAKDFVMEAIEEQFIGGALAPTKIEVFIASFTSAVDLQSQWSSYADQSRGVSVCFDLRQVRPSKQLESTVTFAPCIYEGDSAQRLLSAAAHQLNEAALEWYTKVGDQQYLVRRLRDLELIDRVCRTPNQDNKKALRKILSNEMTTQLQTALMGAKFDLLRLASHVKHPFYAEEHEWRLALPHTLGTPLEHTPLKCRGVGGNIHYIEHDLFHRGHLPITKVMTGRFCTASDEIRRLLDENGYNDVPVIPSSSPSRLPNDIRA